jgi:hypothetical protein
LSIPSPWCVSKRNPVHTLKSLHTKNDDADERPQRKDDGSAIPSIDPLLLMTDLLAIAMSCQLMGLIDVLNDPEFWNHGGWFQPVLVPTTLPTLMQRFSTNSLLWIFVAGVIQSSTYQKEVSLASSKAIRTTMLSSLSIFTLLRLGFSLLLIASDADTTSPVALSSVSTILRECYFVAVATMTGRFALYNLQERL